MRRQAGALMTGKQPVCAVIAIVRISRRNRHEQPSPSPRGSVAKGVNQWPLDGWCRNKGDLHGAPCQRRADDGRKRRKFPHLP